MLLSRLSITNFRCFNEQGTDIVLRKGAVALVGENDSGKTAIIDGIRYALGTSDQEWQRILDTDFYAEDTGREIRIVCRFNELSVPEKGAFLEHLSYVNSGQERQEALIVTWKARKILRRGSQGKSFIKIEVCSGIDGDGPSIQQELRELLRVTYLRPLRDADNSLTSGSRSRLSQILKNVETSKNGEDEYELGMDLSKLSIAGIAQLADQLLSKHSGVSQVRSKIDKGLHDKLLLAQEALKSRIEVAGTSLAVDKRRQLMLEKLNLDITRQHEDTGRLGLGTSNVLYMACELLLLEQEKQGNRMLLVEEPEAHVHPQRQLKIMKSLQEEAVSGGVQVVISTHSPLLASSLKLENLVLVQGGEVFSLGQEYTELSKLDYLFLERFLDSTKANLFFAKGVVIVEGDAEALLLPTIARLLGKDFSNYGISVVNVGGTGLSRFSRIFRRKVIEKGVIETPVACITDFDVMPDCAPEICISKIDTSNPVDWPISSERRWMAVCDFTKDELNTRRLKISKKCDGQKVKTFVSNQWTLEYDLAYSGLGKEVYVAAKMAIKDGANVPAGRDLKEVMADAEAEEAIWGGSREDELKCSRIYSKFTTGTKASKAIAAQYLACLLEKNFEGKEAELRSKLPSYLAEAIDFVTGGSS